MPLTKRPIPYSYESPGSLLLRASYHNGWDRPRLLLSAYGVNKSVLGIMCDRSGWEALCEQCGIRHSRAKTSCYDAKGLTSRGDIEFLGLRVRRKSLRLANPVICPECLVKNGYLPMIWDHNLVVCCSKHGVKLIDYCPSCHRKLSWNRRAISICSCGFHLTQCEVQKIDRKPSLYVESLIRKKNINDLNLLENIHKALTLFYSRNKLAVSSYELVAMSVDVVKGSLSKTSRVIQQVIHSQLVLLGLHPRILVLPLLESNIPICSKLAHDILSRLTGLAKKPSYVSGCCSGSISLFTLGRVLGVSKRKAKTLFLQGGFLEGDGNNVSLASVNRLLYILSIKRRIRNKSATSLHSLFNPPQHHVSLINLFNGILSGQVVYSGMDIQSGVFSINVIPPKVSPPPKGIERETQVNKEYPLPSKDILLASLAEVTKELQVPIQTATTLMKKGFLTEVITMTRYKNVTRESLDHILTIQNDKSLILIADAALALNETLRIMRRYWIESGFIKVIDSGLKQYISIESLDKIQKFKEKYVTSGEAGIITNTHRSYMSNLEKMNKIKPAVQFVSRKKNLNFYERKMVIDIAEDQRELE